MQIKCIIAIWLYMGGVNGWFVYIGDNICKVGKINDISIFILSDL